MTPSPNLVLAARGLRMDAIGDIRTARGHNTPRESQAKAGRVNRRAPVLPLAEAARRLGVAPTHLWAVVNGKRQSAVLTARYNALLIAAAEAVLSGVTH